MYPLLRAAVLAGSLNVWKQLTPALLQPLRVVCLCTMARGKPFLLITLPNLSWIKPLKLKIEGRVFNERYCFYYFISSARQNIKKTKKSFFSRQCCGNLLEPNA